MKSENRRAQNAKLFRLLRVMDASRVATATGEQDTRLFGEAYEIKRKQNSEKDKRKQL